MTTQAHLHDTLTRTLRPIPAGSFDMYVCGPTVYAPIHIGNARPFATYRLLARYMQHRGYNVRHVSNITDINEKIDRVANELGINSMDHAKSMEKAYINATNALGLGRPDSEPRASEHIGGMIEIIQELLDKNLAYVTDIGNVYYNSNKYPDAGALSGRKDDGQNQRDLKGADKLDNADFALWKISTDKLAWDSPWGRGRPGWHLECSAMSRHELGEHFHLHGGGRDLVFPHHEAERAQSRGVGDSHADFWWHTGMITVGGEKGSKTAGNLQSLSGLLNTHDPRVILLSFWSAHPRSDLEWTANTLTMAKSRLDRWENIWMRRNVDKKAGAVQTGLALAPWREAMDNDLDTPKALVHIERLFDRKDAASFAALEIILPLMGIAITDSKIVIPETVNKLVKQRELARKCKDWQLSDELREQIKQEGYIVEDVADGYRLLSS